MKALIVVAALVLIHDAPSGNPYPPLCCNGDGAHGDCHPVDCDSLEETRDGVKWGKIQFTPEQVHPSFDNECHVCVGTTGETPIPHCVFVRPTS